MNTFGLELNTTLITESIHLSKFVPCRPSWNYANNIRTICDHIRQHALINNWIFLYNFNSNIKKCILTKLQRLRRFVDNSEAKQIMCRHIWRISPSHSAHTSAQPQACYNRYSNSNAHCLALILANMNQFLSLVLILFVSHDALIIRVNKLSN